MDGVVHPDVIASYPATASLLISATTGDKWSRGAREVAGDRAEPALYDGGHVFTAAMRARAWEFLSRM